MFHHRMRNNNFKRHGFAWKSYFHSRPFFIEQVAKPSVIRRTRASYFHGSGEGMLIELEEENLRLDAAY